MVAIVGAKGVFHPSRQTWSLIVQKQSSIAHLRFSIGIFTFLNIEVGMFYDGHVSPPIPRRDTYLLRQFVDAKYGAALITTSNHQLVANSLQNILLRLSLQVA